MIINNQGIWSTNLACRDSTATEIITRSTFVLTTYSAMSVSLALTSLVHSIQSFIRIRRYLCSSLGVLILFTIEHSRGPMLPNTLSVSTEFILKSRKRYKEMAGSIYLVVNRLLLCLIVTETDSLGQKTWPKSAFHVCSFMQMYGLSAPAMCQPDKLQPKEQAAILVRFLAT